MDKRKIDQSEFVKRLRMSFVTMGGRPVADLFRRAERAASDTAPTLIMGETGTGKELIARAIHEHGIRRKGPMVTVNCAELRDSDVEPKMFGVKAGAFTDIKVGSMGRLREAHQGTLFLDEIHRIPKSGRDTLLRALESGEVTVHGDDWSKHEKVDVRYISATNADIGDPSVFESDFLARLNTHVIKIPPLRDRKWDTLMLFIYFLDQYTPSGKELREIDWNVLQFLVWYRWPQNVRELRSMTSHLAAEFDPPRIRYENLATFFRHRGWDQAAYERIMTEKRKTLLIKDEPNLAESYGTTDFFEFNRFIGGGIPFWFVGLDVPETELAKYFKKPFEVLKPLDVTWFIHRYPRELLQPGKRMCLVARESVCDYGLMRTDLIAMFEEYGGDLPVGGGRGKTQSRGGSELSIITKEDFHRSITATYERTGRSVGATAKIHGVSPGFVRKRFGSK